MKLLFSSSNKLLKSNSKFVLSPVKFIAKIPVSSSVCLTKAKKPGCSFPPGSWALKLINLSSKLTFIIIT